MIQPNLKCIPALTEEQRQTAYRMRYIAYVTDDHIDPNPTGLFSDEYDLQPNSPTFLLVDDKQPIGSVRASIYTGEPGWDCIPAMATFNAEIEREVGLDKRFVEANRLVILPERSKTGLLPLAMLVSNIARVADEYRCDFVIAAVRTEHVPFYKQLSFRAVTEPRLYHGLKFMTTLLICDWSDGGEKIRRHPLFASVFNERNG